MSLPPAPPSRRVAPSDEPNAAESDQVGGASPVREDGVDVPASEAFAVEEIEVPEPLVSGEDELPGGFEVDYFEQETVGVPGLEDEVTSGVPLADPENEGPEPEDSGDAHEPEGTVESYPGGLPNGSQARDIPPERQKFGRMLGVTFVNHEGVKVTAVDSGKHSAATGRITTPKGASKERQVAKTVGDSVRVESRDLLWLQSAARYSWLSYEELMVFAHVYGWEGTKLSTISARIVKLVSAGVLDSWRVPSSGVASNLVTPNRRALARYGLDVFRVREPNAMDVLHTSSVARLGLYLESLDLLCRETYVVTENEIMALNRTGQMPLMTEATSEWGSAVPDITDRYRFVTPRDTGFTWRQNKAGEDVLSGGFFQPDLVLLRREGGPIAIEVERVAKADSTIYEEKFASYVASGRFAGVQYVCMSSAIAETVRRAVKATPGASDVIAVEQFPDARMPLPPLRLERITAMKLPRVREMLEKGE